MKKNTTGNVWNVKGAHSINRKVKERGLEGKIEIEKRIQA